MGELLRFEAHYNRFKPVLNAKKWKETPGPASGILYDLGAHIIDQSIALFGVPKNVWGQTYTQRTGSDIDDAFDIFMDYGRLKVHLSSSLLVREETPRYVLHGTNGSFVKYGIDLQEDHLKAGMMPGDAGFGVEDPAFQGILYSEKDGTTTPEKIETFPGNWGILFQNIAEVIQEQGIPLIPLSDIASQISIMEQVGVVTG